MSKINKNLFKNKERKEKIKMMMIEVMAIFATLALVVGADAVSKYITR